ncbi:c-type cytochrome [Sporosarcina limicola]|uniref:Thiosulfate dehydrogenase n=1 Tax=Sporosarcina limicola TaxID=34101 RepID=A0A927MNA1_9BACL|nr:c-type cytochrome [Sporosarcina limicola]MBE1556252.1 thiosulfate dehydrogenase [Sporosarcina limicola]
MRNSTTFILGFLFVVSLAVIGMMANQLKVSKETANQPGAPTETEAPTPQVAGITHTPPSLDDVPEGPLGEAILRGYELTNDTSNVLRAEAASVEDGEARVNALSCTSCHAGAGLEEETSSLVGMSAVYPMFIGRSGQIVTLEERINGCMVRSMNGQKFADDDEDLDAMVAYLTYISEGIPVGAELPWRGQSDMKDVPTPSVADGEELYQQSCIACHAGDGSGTGSNSGPALWGDESFNDGAGIARVSKMAGYIKNNMPIGAANTLSDQEASDLAAFILSQDRPEWGKHDKDWPGGGRPSDIMTKELRQQVKDGTVDWDEVLGKNK